ncbi:hypothetical protein [Geoalkalibacter halelectricus]|uniref:Uncharacterized protein n=1 Tax=Geoalkalibacter halelectricus TaxID=2847045 RepID=A0ABY5ZFG3_9BACT|nr:hypothetical protein [Geoalkalibacter halelectricus]MDO3377909.1 hypothetical protein [Geoalkalibacter halelectricus]UWZ77910.1 hypothetical protein L9S41_09355 [Geoalkalibacter halelectricus]
MTLALDAPHLLGLAGALLALGLAAYLLVRFLRYQRARRYRRHFQVLWDRKLRPRCPRCRGLLGEWGMHQSLKFEKHAGRMTQVPVSFGAFRCEPCGTLVRLVDEDGFEMDYQQALTRLGAETTPAGSTLSRPNELTPGNP